jgi:hypothetical protein
MRKVISALLIAVTLILVVTTAVLAIDITNAKYLTRMTVNNSTAGAITNGAVAVNIVTGDYINQYMLDATATEMGLTNGAGTSYPVMPGVGSNPMIIFPASVPASAQVEYMLYTDDVTAGDIVYAPEDGGMTIPDAMTNEGNSFKWEGTVYLPETSGYLYYHQDATNGGCNIYYNGSTDTLTTNVSVPRGGPTPVIAGTADTNTDVYGTSHTAQLPVSIASGNLLLLIVYGNNASYTVTTPSGWTVLAQGNTYINYNYYYKIATGSEGTTVAITTSGSTLVTARAYRITGFKPSGYIAVSSLYSASTSTSIDTPALTSGFGAVNTLWMTIGGGTTAYSVTSYPASYTNTGFVTNASYSPLIVYATRAYANATEDPGAFVLSDPTNVIGFTIAISPDNGFVTATKTGATGGLHTVSGELTSGTLKATWDGSSGTMAYAGSIPNSTAVFTMVQGGACLYMVSANYTQGGTLRGNWAYSYNTTFPDLSGNGNTATPTFRITSTTGLTSTLVSQSSLLTSSGPIVTDSPVWSLISDAEETILLQEPAHLNTEGGTNFLAYGFFNTIAGYLRIPYVTIMYIVALGSVILVGLIVLKLTHKPEKGIKSSLFLVSMGMLGAMAFWVAIGDGVITGWLLIPLGIWAGVSLIIKNQYNQITS